MSIRYVVDTNCIISYYSEIFKDAPNYQGSRRLSRKTRGIIFEAIDSGMTDIRLSIPSVVFVEIYEKWLKTEEFLKKFFYEVFVPLRDSPNVEIRSNDREALENLLNIGFQLDGHDLHDKLVLAAAMALQAPLITTDQKIIDYVNEEQVIPAILN